MNKRKKSKWGLFLVIGIIVYFSYILIDQQKILYVKENQMASIDKKIEEQNRINEELKRKKEILDTDEYAEKVARDKLGMVKPGERVFVDTNK